MTEEEYEQLKIGGVKVHYSVVCARKLCLYSHEIRMGPSSALDAHGEALAGAHLLSPAS